MKVHVITYFPCDSKEPFLFNAAQEIKDDTTVKKMVTAALQAASSDMAFDDILSDTDKEIIADANHFSKTVKLTNEISLQVNIE